MRKLIFSMNISLDGYADHTVALADDQMHEFYADQLDSLDTIVFGRVAYQLLESYWPLAPNDPQATKSMIKFADKINSLPKVVFSKTLESVHWNNTVLVRGNIVEAVSKLKQGTGKGLSVGGISVAQALMRMSLIDEYWLLIQPVIVGKGRRLFDITDRLNLKLVESKTFHSGVVVLHYVPEGNHSAREHR
jgi:dihydrofolate reductase